LVALMVRIPGLTESLWFDEVWFTKVFFEQPDQLGFLLFEDVHPPFYGLLLLAWTDLFGDSELVVRLPSLLCGLGSLALLWFMTRRWLGPPYALLVAGLLALSPPHIWYSHENKVNMLLLLLIIEAVWLYWRASHLRLPRDWILATITMILALYTHSYAVPVAAAIFFWLVWRVRSDATLIKPLVISALVVALVIAPFVILKISQGSDLERDYLRQLSSGEIYKLLLVWLPSGNTLRTVGPYGSFSELVKQPWPYFLIEAFFAVLLLRGLLVMGRRARGDGWLAPVSDPAIAEPARLILLWFIVPLLFTYAGSLVFRHFYIERNLLVILPPFLLLLVAGADIGASRWARAFASAGLVTLAISATISLNFVKTDVWTVYKYKPDWRSLAQYLSNEVKTSGVLRILVTNPTYEVDYYRRHIKLAEDPASPTSNPEVSTLCGADNAKIPETILEKGWSTFYLVHNSTWYQCWDGAFKSISSAPQFTLVEKREFKGLTVYKFKTVKIP
jgi:mannosyltransferase